MKCPLSEDLWSNSKVLSFNSAWKCHAVELSDQMLYTEKTKAFFFFSFSDMVIRKVMVFINFFLCINVEICMVYGIISALLIIHILTCYCFNFSFIPCLSSWRFHGQQLIVLVNGTFLEDKTPIASRNISMNYLMLPECLWCFYPLGDCYVLLLECIVPQYCLHLYMGTENSS